MKRATIFVAYLVYESTVRFVDESWLSYPWYVINIAAAKVLDALDPVNGVSGS